MFIRNSARLFAAYQKTHASREEKLGLIEYCKLMIKTAEKHDKEKPNSYDK